MMHVNTPSVKLKRIIIIILVLNSGYNKSFSVKRSY